MQDIIDVCPSNRPQLTDSPRMHRDRIDRRSRLTAFHCKNRKRVPAVDTFLMRQGFIKPIRVDLRPNRQKQPRDQRSNSR